MNLTLKRNEALESGIFGVLLDDQGQQIAVTLEHAYDSGNGDGSYSPKTPVGTYTCVKGQHQLAHMTSPFETFEVTNVPGHTNILIHKGNYNDDSEGCILLGLAVQNTDTGKMITSSAPTFNKFMALQHNVDEFILTIE